MNNEVHAGTARLLKHSREIAQKYKLSKANPLCLLMSVIDEGLIVVSLLKQLGVNVDALIQEIEKAFANNSDTTEVAETQSADLLPELDSICVRITKLLVLEDKIANGKRQSDLLLTLAILHDRDNDAKSMLYSYKVTYDTLLKEANVQQSEAEYKFPDEDDSPYPNDDHTSGEPAARQKEPSKKGTSDTPITDNFGTDLTAIALKGGLDPVIGRESEIQRVIQILCRRKKNNPIIIGEPGVGKSAIVEGLADSIAHKRVPRLADRKTNRRTRYGFDCCWNAIQRPI